MKWLRRHIVFTNLSLIGVAVGVAFLVWFIFDGRKTFGPLDTYAFVYASVIVASVAALNSQMIMKWFKRHIIRTNLVLIGIEVAVACLVWFIFDGRQTFGPLNTYVIVCLSVVVASIAALNSIFASVNARDSLVTTQESLKLTRNSIRPFLYTAGPIEPQRLSNRIIIKFAIHNSGSLPAESVQTDIQFFDRDEEVTEKNLSSKYVAPPVEPIAPIIFPNSKIYRSYVLNLAEADDAELFENMQHKRIKCRVRTTYTSLGRKHITIQTIQLAEIEWGKEIAAHPIPPQKWK